MAAGLTALLLMTARCGPEPVVEQVPPEQSTVAALRLLGVSAPEVWTDGTVLTASLLVAGEVPEAARLLVYTQGSSESVAELEAEQSDPLQLTFVVNPSFLAAVGEGTRQVEVAVAAGGLQSNRLPLDVNFRDLLRPSLANGDYSVRVADVVLLELSEMLLPGEGEVTGHFTGDFLSDSGVVETVAFNAPVQVYDSRFRSLAWWNIPSDITGLRTGRMTGNLTLQVTTSSGASSEIDAGPISIMYVAPDLVQAVGNLAAIYVGGSVAFVGGGFPRDERVIAEVEFRGELTDVFGGTREIVLRGQPVAAESAGKARVFLEPVLRDGMVIAEIPGEALAEFFGEAQLVLRSAQSEIRSDATRLTFTIQGVRQYVLIEFNEGFYSALQKFGLLAVANRIEERVIARLKDIYDGINVQFIHAHNPALSRQVVTVVEIGGTDPNGLGLFGYDNSPGKDVGNIRMDEFIGGANAATQADGAPGYGGVFVESFLYWSETARASLPASAAAPEPDADFERVFAPFIARAATVDEAYGDRGRIDDLDAAVDALGALIAETAAHELGHALGLANPEDPDGSFHNATDGAGCLMDDGDSRAPGERMGLRGFPQTHLCADERAYLESILP